MTNVSCEWTTSPCVCCTTTPNTAVEFSSPIRPSSCPWVGLAAALVTFWQFLALFAPWPGTCVGAYNHKPFLQFLFYTLILGTYSFVSDLAWGITGLYRSAVSQLGMPNGSWHLENGTQKGRRGRRGGRARNHGCVLTPCLGAPYVAAAFNAAHADGARRHHDRHRLCIFVCLYDCRRQPLNVAARGRCCSPPPCFSIAPCRYTGS